MNQWSELAKVAERELIHTLFNSSLEPEELSQLFSSLPPDHFSDPMCAHAYSLAMGAYAGGEITKANVIAVSMEMPSPHTMSVLNIFGEEKARSQASGLDIETLRKIVTEFYSRRFLVGLAGSDVGAENSAELSARMLDGLSVVAGLSGASYGENVADGVGDIVSSALSGGERPAVVPTGFVKLDELFSGGFIGGQFIVLAARPGEGKTTLALNIAQNVAYGAGGNVIVFSLEMVAREVQEKILASEAEVPLSVIKGGQIEPNSDAHRKLLEASHSIQQSPGNIIINDSTNNTVASVSAFIKSQMMKMPIDLVIIDYIQLMTGTGANRQEEVSSISRSLKILTKELNIPILAMSQLNRNVVDKNGKKRMPTLSDLRESGAIEQDANIIMFIGPPKQDEEESDSFVSDLSIPLAVAKNRSGATGVMRMSPLLEYSTFREVPENSDVPDFLTGVEQ